MAKTPFKLRSGNTTPFKMMGSSPMRKDEKKQKEVNPFDLYTRPGTPNGESDPKQDATGKTQSIKKGTFPGKEGSVKVADEERKENIDSAKYAGSKLSWKYGAEPAADHASNTSDVPKTNDTGSKTAPKYPEGATIFDKIFYDKEGYRRRFGINNPEKRKKIEKLKETRRAEVDAWKKN